MRQENARFVYEVAGLEEAVELLVDRWGVPHIYAASAYDAFFAQGFNAALATEPEAGP